ncbi:hypothetical protein MtrunA17_Chr3g0095191 [Medicago truncatula]|uniref:Uncharacterized protein n=1 Tax=Medicago truncatula TaxID=3880 RepID=A0A072UX23_MEDTR|nr:hypothetical protein MTR_3g449530 [Medicago truncatula]RHN66771.1 hypothetical protein MtrunA17_Chr3g0095191 [Medicago truncatula]
MLEIVVGMNPLMRFDLKSRYSNIDKLEIEEFLQQNHCSSSLISSVSADEVTLVETHHGNYCLVGQE